MNLKGHRIILNKNNTKYKISDDVVSLDELKRKFKKERRHYYIFLILVIFSLVYFFNAAVDFNVLYLFMAILLSGLAILVHQSYKKRNQKTGHCSADSISYLKKLYDQYSKRTINSIFLGLTIFIYFAVFIIGLKQNSKTSEILEFVYTNLFYVEIIFLIFGKNLLLTRWLGNMIQDAKVKKFYQHLKRIIVLSVFYWMIFLLLIIVFQNAYYANVFLIAAVLYAIGILVYNLIYRKKIVYHNLVINKKRAIIYFVIIFIFSGYQFMQRDFWLTQPYINSVPNIYDKANKIEYNEETGVYTITNDNKDDFKILQLTDIHLGGSVFSYRKDMKALKAVYELIDHTDPDFVIVTGDLTFPMGIMIQNLLPLIRNKI